MKCPSCGTTNPPSQRFCGQCGAAVISSDSETIASPHPVTPRIVGDKEHYVPGQILAGRYRMVGLLGRGGMGEVYRADDLKLGQPVALKFLPRPVENDPDRLQRFLDEVRLSLKVTHPNVCRVFDLGDVDGRHFLSMEYVDGEDLASLLRRIGRLPEDKAVEIARQLCAGLAAAHDEGVLHRDLKPANVMIDGRGRAKITDFGLAGATAGVSGREAQAGTPQYMAPEQFEGKELSVQTDIYSLGLVLYELFTGKRAFDGRDLEELKLLHSSAPTSPSAHVSGLNPVVERAILRCVSPDPAQRPKSASALAAALPGGDPLEMAIAAGETPSPEMVAQSGGGGELRVGIAAAYLAVVLAGLGAVWVFYSSIALPNRVPMPKPPEELRIAARAIITAAGYTSVPSGSTYGFWRDTDYFAKVSKENQSVDRWDRLAEVTPPLLGLWYREAPGGMGPFNNVGRASQDNPPVDVPGMIAIRVDPNGRLMSFRAVPPIYPETKGPWPEPDWTPLFVAAGQTMGEWQSSEPGRTPAMFSDLRRAWSKGTLRIEAASMRGRPVWFYVNPEWHRPTDASTATSSAFEFVLGGFAVVVALGVTLAGALLARRNIRLDRADKRGARRLATVYLILGAVYEALRLNGSPGRWFDVFTANLAGHVFSAAVIWIFYLAIEPYVRRQWPATLVAWGRVLEGRFRDPMVGRHILIGAMFGVFFSFLQVSQWFNPLVGRPAPAPSGNGDLEAVSSWLLRVSDFCIQAQSSFFIPVAMLLAVLVVRVVFRRVWLAYTMTVLIPAVFISLAALQPNSDMTILNVITSVMFVILLLVILTRVGLFALLVCILFSYWSSTVLTLNPASWFFIPSVLTMAFYAAVAGYAFWISLGEQRLFRDAI